MAARASSGFGERTNEYFVDGEGISREVIQADICRYLGNDALVRTGTNQQVRLPPGPDLIQFNHNWGSLYFVIWPAANNYNRADKVTLLLLIVI